MTPPSPQELAAISKALERTRARESASSLSPWVLASRIAGADAEARASWNHSDEPHGRDETY